MTTDIAVREPQEVINPATGEALELTTAPTDRIAQERRGVTDLKAVLDDYATFLDAELNIRLDKGNTRSAWVGEWELSTKAPTQTVYPVDVLGRVLDELIAAGKLEQDVKDRVLVPQPPPPPKVSKREVTKLLAHSDQDVRVAVMNAGTQEPQRRTVAVKKVGE